MQWSILGIEPVQERTNHLGFGNAERSAAGYGPGQVCRVFCRIAISPGKNPGQGFSCQRTEVTGGFGWVIQSAGQQHRSLNVIANRGHFGSLDTVFNDQDQHIGPQWGHQCIAGQDEQKASQCQSMPFPYRIMQRLSWPIHEARQAQKQHADQQRYKG